MWVFSLDPFVSGSGFSSLYILISGLIVVKCPFMLFVELPVTKKKKKIFKQLLDKIPGYLDISISVNEKTRNIQNYVLRFQ